MSPCILHSNGRLVVESQLWFKGFNSGAASAVYGNLTCEVYILIEAATRPNVDRFLVSRQIGEIKSLFKELNMYLIAVYGGSQYKALMQVNEAIVRLKLQIVLKGVTELWSWTVKLQHTSRARTSQRLEGRAPTGSAEVSGLTTVSEHSGLILCRAAVVESSGSLPTPASLFTKHFS